MGGFRLKLGHAVFKVSFAREPVFISKCSDYQGTGYMIGCFDGVTSGIESRYNFFQGDIGFPTPDIEITAQPGVSLQVYIDPVIGF